MTKERKGWLLTAIVLASMSITLMCAGIRGCSKKENRELPPLKELMPEFDVEKIATLSSTNYVVKFKEHDTDRWIYCKDAICDTEKEAWGVVERSRSNLKIKYEFGKKILEGMR